jgi:hypothetical protein
MTAVKNTTRESGDIYHETWGSAAKSRLSVVREGLDHISTARERIDKCLRVLYLPLGEG